MTTIEIVELWRAKRRGNFEVTENEWSLKYSKAQELFDVTEILMFFIDVNGRSVQRLS